MYYLYKNDWCIIVTTVNIILQGVYGNYNPTWILVNLDFRFNIY